MSFPFHVPDHITGPHTSDLQTSSSDIKGRLNEFRSRVNGGDSLGPLRNAIVNVSRRAVKPVDPDAPIDVGESADPSNFAEVTEASQWDLSGDLWRSQLLTRRLDEDSRSLGLVPTRHRRGRYVGRHTPCNGQHVQGQPTERGFEQSSSLVGNQRAERSRVKVGEATLTTRRRSFEQVSVLIVQVDAEN